MFLRLFVVLALSLTSSASAAERMVVFAAASLKGPLDQVFASNENIAVSYGGSGALARQVLAGAPADVVILANPDWMSVLTEAAVVDESSVKDVLSNRLVLVSGQRNELTLTTTAIGNALGDGRLATGYVNAVPAGQYGKAALENLGLWDAVRDRLAETDSVRAAVTLVSRGAAPLAIAYATDAIAFDTLHVVARFPTNSYPTIRYQAGIVSQSERGSTIMDLLGTEQAAQIFADAGFLPPEPVK